MIDKIEEYISSHNMLKRGDHVVAGVSGGADSTCLLDVLCELRKKYDLKITAVHINHSIRGEEADKDAEFVREFCKERNVDFKLYTFPVERYAAENSLTVEEAGRKLRYKAFNEIAGSDGKIAVAHNMNDNAETMLMRFFRGTGIKGLGGILPVRDNIIRPLLCVKRAEIEEYCHKKGILYRTDATNLVEDYTRNKIRLSLIPQIEESFNKSVTETMFRTAQLISDENAYIEKTAEDAYNDCLCGENKISIEKLMKYDKVIRRRIVRKGFVNYSVDLHDIAFDHVEAVLSLTDKKSGSEIRLPNGLFAVREFDSIAFKKKNGETKGFCFDIHTDEEVFLPTCGIKILLTKDRKNEGLKNKGLKNEGFEKEKFTEICLDADKFDVEKAVIRTRQTGDKIYLKGINGNKSIKKLFTEYKIPSAQRDEIPMLAIGSDIVWVKDMKTSGRYKAEEDTENVIYLYVRR